MADTLLLERDVVARDEDTAGYAHVGWAPVYQGPAKYRPGTPRQIEQAAARGVKLDALIRVPLTAICYAGLRGYVTGPLALEEEGTYARLVTVTEVHPAPGRRMHQLLAVLDVDYDVDRPA